MKQRLEKQQCNEIECWFFEKIDKIRKTLARLIKNESRKTHY